MSNYLSPVLDYTAVASYPTNPQVTIPFEPRVTNIQNESATGDVFISFDGINDHMHIVAGRTYSTTFTRLQKIWFRSGTTGTTGLRIAAEG